jgi:hypothetical protein
LFPAIVRWSPHATSIAAKMAAAVSTATKQAARRQRRAGVRTAWLTPLITLACPWLWHGNVGFAKLSQLVTHWLIEPAVAYSNSFHVIA